MYKYCLLVRNTQELLYFHKRGQKIKLLLGKKWKSLICKQGNSARPMQVLPLHITLHLDYYITWQI